MRRLFLVVVSLSFSGCVAVTGGMRNAPRPAASVAPARAAGAPAVWHGWLVWTNPCDPDLLYRTFYAVRQGNGTDTLKSAPYPLAGADEEPLLARGVRRAATWTRSGPCQPDSTRFTVPPGAWDIAITATDTTGINESGKSNHVTVTQP